MHTEHAPQTEAITTSQVITRLRRAKRPKTYRSENSMFYVDYYSEFIVVTRPLLTAIKSDVLEVAEFRQHYRNTRWVEFPC